MIKIILFTLALFLDKVLVMDEFENLSKGLFFGLSIKPNSYDSTFDFKNLNENLNFRYKDANARSLNDVFLIGSSKTAEIAMYTYSFDSIPIIGTKVDSGKIRLEVAKAGKHHKIGFHEWCATFLDKDSATNAYNRMCALFKAIPSRHIPEEDYWKRMADVIAVSEFESEGDGYIKGASIMLFKTDLGYDIRFSMVN